jgi:hypothetical protein
MNKAATLSFLAAILFCTPACEQQSYDETKMFNQSNKVGGHGGDHGKDAEKGAEKKAGH